MKIVIVGAGKVGFILAKELCHEDHSVVIIDNNQSVLAKLQDTLDVAVVNGNGSVVEIQNEANVQSSDILIATTQSDELNLLCCLVARTLGCKHTLARVRNPEYDQQIDFLCKNFGLSMAINPEKSAAREIHRLLQYPSFLKRDSFSGGRIEIVEFKVSPDSVLCEQSLDKLSDIWKTTALVCVVDRGGEITVPRGEFCINAGDKLTVAADSTSLVALINNIGISKRRIKKVMLVGGGRIALYLARMLNLSKVDVTIIEQDEERCVELSELLPKASVLLGNGTNQELLLAEGIESMDAVVTLTGMDEENLLVSMFANSLKVPKTITKINRVEYSAVLGSVGIDTIISPKMFTADNIVRYVRAVGESGTGSVKKAEQTGTVDTLYRIADGKAEALGFTVPQDFKYSGIPLAELHFNKNILIAGIIHLGHVVIPNGFDSMCAGDSVVVVTTSEQTISSITDIFAEAD